MTLFCLQAYSLISAKKGVCGKFDMVCFRNPHGRNEFTGGGWFDGGPMWQEYPDAAKASEWEGEGQRMEGQSCRFRAKKKRQLASGRGDVTVREIADHSSLCLCVSLSTRFMHLMFLLLFVSVFL